MNNFEIIKPLLKFENPNEFYFLQIIARKKDIEGMKGNNRVIKDYYIFSLKDLEDKMEEIIKLCDLFQARAYIRLSRRNSETIAKKMIAELGLAFQNNSFQHLRKIYSTVVGKDKGLDNLRLIDVDFDSGVTFVTNPIRELGAILADLKPIGEKIIASIPTKNGVHIITRPFDLQAFKEIFTQMEIHKNNPTLLYF
jgi:hypothetical protein